jgi:hypothetical protein
MVMDSKTHNGTLAGLAFRYRDAKSASGRGRVGIASEQAGDAG